MSDTAWALAVDFGTSRSGGAMFADGSVTPLEVEGNRWMASQVVLHPDGTVLVGAAAEAAAAVYPDRVERTPKEKLGSPAPLLLGGAPLSACAASAAVLAVFLEEGRLRRGGSEPTAAVLTHPVRWGDPRKAALAEAARTAGLPQPWLVEEPVAAAVHYAGDGLPAGAHVGVYDLGGGTFDTAVLRRTDTGFEVVGAPGGDETIGGEVFDHHLFHFFGELLAAEDQELWERMCTSDERRWKQAALELLTQARRAKEALSSYTSTQVFVPAADLDLLVNRSQLEAMILDDVERTVDLMEETVTSAGLTASDLSAVYLVGGSSRIPLVVQLLTERFGDRVTTRDEPKSVVALGAAAIAGAGLATSAPARARGAARRDATPLLVVDYSTEQGARLLWRLQLARPPGGIGVAEGTVLVSTQDGDLHAFDVSTGARRWAVHLGTWAAPAPVSAHGTVVVAGGDGTLAALHLPSGGLHWRVPTGAPLQGSAVVTPWLVIAGNDAGRVMALDRATGRTVWHLPVGAPVRADLVPGGDGAVIVASLDGRVLAVDAALGTPRWGYATGGAVTGAPAVVGSTVLVPAGDGLLYALDAATGSALWAHGTGAPLRTAVACDGDRAYVASGDGYLHCLDVGTGAGLWRHPCGQDSSGPCSGAGTVCYDTGSGELQAIATAGSRMRWRVATGAGNRCRPAICAGVVVACTTFHQLYAIAP